MNGTPDIRYDVASVLNRGHRDYQEDALATDFPLGADFGYAVLSDGMGGHAAGDVASKIVVTEVFSELKFQSSDAEGFEADIGNVLKDGACSSRNRGLGFAGLDRLRDVSEVGNHVHHQPAAHVSSWHASAAAASG